MDIDRVEKTMIEFSERFRALINERERYGKEMIETQRMKIPQDFPRLLTETREGLSLLRRKFFDDFLQRIQSFTPEEEEKAVTRMDDFMQAVLNELISGLVATLNKENRPE